MTAEGVEIHSADVYATSQSSKDGAQPKHQAACGTWPRGSMGEDIVDDVGTEASEKQAA